jgi:hypothetical protein
MDFFVILVLVVWMKAGGDVKWMSRSYEGDMQSCLDEASAIKEEQKAHPEVKDAQGYCIPFSLRKEARR